MRKPKLRKPKVAMLPFPNQHGGHRAGAGRKPKGDKAGVSHRQREALGSQLPAHVTLKLKPGLPPLRRRREYETLREAFALGCDRNGFRLCHYAVMNDHLHFVVEALDRAALTRGVQGLVIRIARALNKQWQRKGKLFADRFHDRLLETPLEVRNVLRYVFANGKKHAAEGREVRVAQAIDTFTSAPWFDGFRETVTVRGLHAIERPVAMARTWLLRTGWRRHGLLGVHETPAAQN